MLFEAAQAGLPTPRTPLSSRKNQQHQHRCSDELGGDQVEARSQAVQTSQKQIEKWSVHHAHVAIPRVTRVVARVEAEWKEQG